jgi:hypothetical protein
MSYSFTRRAFLSASAGAVGLPALQAFHRCASVCPSPTAAFTCDFEVANTLTPDKIAPVLEVDRRHMSARPGFAIKHVPLRIPPGPGPLVSGGRYLFDSMANAQAYQTWLTNDFVLDGTKFFARPYVANAEYRVWSVSGVMNAGVPQVVTRMERWTVPADFNPCILQKRWNTVVAEALKRGVTGAWLLTAPGAVGLVYYRGRTLPSAPAEQNDPQKVAVASLAAIEAIAPLGNVFDDPGWTRVFDRSSWVLTTWFPLVSPDRGALWPNSPPLPKP